MFELLETEGEDVADKPNAQPEEDAPDKQGDDAEPDFFTGLEQTGKSMQARVNVRIEKGLNELGEEGWELCARSEQTFYLKRQRR